MNYTRFIILGQERTGSIYLQRLLDSHPAIYNVGEVFNQSLALRQTIKKLERPIEDNEAPIAYLEKIVFREYPPPIRAVGFRLFYDHARNKAWRGVWEYLRQRQVRVIHLQRFNLLDRYLSLQLAQRSNIWIKINEGPSRHEAPIVLDPKACFKDIYRSQGQQQAGDKFFAHNPKITILYEELSRDPEATCRKILDFLELQWHPLRSQTKKQRLQKKPQIIENYEILRDYLIRHSYKPWIKKSWLAFFDDE